jgi:hypothetical protein
MSPERHSLKLKAMSVDFDNVLVKAKEVIERQAQDCTLGDPYSMAEPTNTQANQFLNGT